MSSAEVLSIGTELLLGQVLDTNSQFIALELAKLGIDSFFRVTVGDNKDRIKSALHAALSRSDILITSGGLGPTADDLTTECIAELFGAPLVMDSQVLEHIERLFALRNYKMPETNKKAGSASRRLSVAAKPGGNCSGDDLGCTGKVS